MYECGISSHFQSDMLKGDVKFSSNTTSKEIYVFLALGTKNYQPDKTSGKTTKISLIPCWTYLFFILSPPSHISYLWKTLRHPKTLRSCIYIKFASFIIVPQCLSTRPFCSWCLGATMVNLMLFSLQHFLNVSNLNSIPASVLIWDIFLSFVLLFGILDTRSSISSIYASVDSSYIPINLKVVEYLSHNIRK